jgi:hypothetical protein
MQQNSESVLNRTASIYSLFHKNSQSVTVEKETPLEVDPGLLLVTDLNPIEEETYKFVSEILNREYIPTFPSVKI